jgi:glutaredoxin
MKPTLYLFTQEGCVNCPAAKAAIDEAFDDSDVQIRTVDLKDMDSDFEYILLEHQIFIASTPAIIVENNGKMKMLYSGQIPDIETIRREVREFR